MLLILVPILAVFLLAALVAISRSARFKGMMGEAMVRRALQRGLELGRFRVLHNLTLPHQDHTTQIDHLVLSRFGLFTIETKHLAGWVFACATDATWTQTFGRKKFTFQNPLRQNHAHVSALQAITGLPEEVVRPVVVMTGKAKFKTGMPKGVMRLQDLVNWIRAAPTVVLSEEQIEAACSAIEAARLEPGAATDQAHVESLARRFGRQAKPMAWCLARPYLAVFGLKLAAFGLLAVLCVSTYLLVMNAVIEVNSIITKGAGTSKPAVIQQPPGEAVGKPSLSTGIDQPVSKDEAISSAPERMAPGPAPLELNQPAVPSKSSRSSQESQAIVQALRQQRMQQVDAGAGASRLREFEAGLNCGYSSDTRRCACYTDVGARILVDAKRCRALAMEADVVETYE